MTISYDNYGGAAYTVEWDAMLAGAYTVAVAGPKTRPVFSAHDGVPGCFIERRAAADLLRGARRTEREGRRG